MTSHSVVFNNNVVQMGGVETKKWINAEKRARRASMTAGLMHWRDKFLPLHFGSQAAQRYGYVGRDFSYLQSKGQLRYLRESEFRGTVWADRKPLERTGGLRRQVLKDAPKFSLRKSGSELVMSIPAPKYLYMWRNRTKARGTRPPNKAAELTTLRAEEESEMYDVVGSVYEANVAVIFDKQARARRAQDRKTAREAKKAAAAQATGYAA